MPQGSPEVIFIFPAHPKTPLMSYIQSANLLYEERGVQSDPSDPVAERYTVGKEKLVAHSPPTLYSLVPQVPYRAIRQRFTGHEDIEFIVNGEVGIRLSDALAGNWTGFENRDDRPFFGGDQVQILVRLRVRLSIDMNYRLH
jgi:hypothetical protein